MDKKNWLKKLKEGLLFIQEPMVLELIWQDSEYQQSAKELNFYESQLQKMIKNMERNQAETIENVMISKDSNNLDYSSLSFIAGIQTGYWLKELLSVKENIGLDEGLQDE